MKIFKTGLVLSILLILTSCSILPQLTNAKAILHINLDKPSSRVLLPEGQTISYYGLTVSPATSELGDTVTLDNTQDFTGSWELLPGEWKIEVRGYSSTGVILVQGTKTISLVAGTNTATISLRPVQTSGKTGTLHLGYGWLGTSNKVSAKISPFVDGVEGVSEEIIPDEATGNFSLSFGSGQAEFVANTEIGINSITMDGTFKSGTYLIKLLMWQEYETAVGEPPQVYLRSSKTTLVYVADDQITSNYYPLTIVNPALGGTASVHPDFVSADGLYFEGQYLVLQAEPDTAQGFQFNYWHSFTGGNVQPYNEQTTNPAYIMGSGPSQLTAEFVKPADAPIISLGSTTNGSLINNYERDFYRFNLNEGTNIIFTCAAADSLYAYFSVNDLSNPEANFYINPGEAAYLPAGSYYVYIYGSYGVDVDYTFSMQVSP